MKNKVEKRAVCGSVGTTRMCCGCGARHLHLVQYCEQCPVNPSAKCNEVYTLNHNKVIVQGFKSETDMQNSLIRTEPFFKGETSNINKDVMRKFLERINSGWRNYNPDKLIQGVKLHKLNYIEHSFESLLEILDNPTHVIIYV